MGEHLEKKEALKRPALNDHQARSRAARANHQGEGAWE